MSVPDILPPSPPTTLSRKPMDFGRSLSKPTTTPDDSPASLANSSGGIRKKVEFSPWTNVHDPPAFTPTIDQTNTIKFLPPSRDCQTLSKSILKPSNERDMGELSMDGQQDTHLSSDEIMDSIVQQLSTGDKATRVDAYHTLVSLLKAYDEIPEAVVLKNRLSSVTKFIRRDLTIAEKEEVDPTDTNLVTQTLKASVSLVWSQDFSPHLPDEFRAFLIDRAIQVLTERKVPKSNLVHYLHLLSTQNFRPNIIQSNNRALKLLDALKLVAEHYTGNGVAGERLLVYVRLLDQARPIMQSKAASWLQELLMGLVSPSKDTRSKALKLGMRACTVFSSSMPIANCLREVLKVEVEHGRDIDTYVARRLEKMVANREDGVQVPQSWTTVVLLMGGLRGGIESWISLKSWLAVIQRCFNCSDTNTRQEANLAWNRFVSMVRPHDGSQRLVSMLVKPISTQLERNVAERHTKTSRTSAVAGYCNLLYYAFRPKATHKQYSRSWNEYVVKVMTSSFFERNAANADLACRVLMTLFWDSSSTTKVWKEHRAHENRPVSPEELPTIDCKWIRAKADSILQIFDVVARYSSWGPTGDSDQAFVAQTWRHFVKAIGESCCREIKPSSETKQAISYISRYFCELENRLDAEAKESSLSRLRLLASTAVSQLSAMPVIEVIEADRSLISNCLTNELLHSVVDHFNIMDRNGPNASLARFGSRNLTNPASAITKLLSLLDEDLVQLYQTSQTTRLDKSSVNGQTYETHGEVSDVSVSLYQRDNTFFSQPFDTAHQLMRSTEKNSLHKFLTGLQKSFCLWLEDAAGVCANSASRKLTLSIVENICHLELRDLDEFDALLAAGFRSTHNETLGLMIELWCKNFPQQDHAAYPPLLHEALERLGPFIDINVRRSQMPADQPVELLYPRSQLRAMELHVCPVPEEQTPPGSAPPAVDETSTAFNREEGQVKNDQLTVGSARSTEFNTPTRKVRHHDSQVHFVEIESSPMATGEVDSQSLTGNQIDVRNRQRVHTEIAAFFSDLGSKSIGTVERDGPLNGMIARRAASEEQIPATPTLPVPGDFEEVAASPTPRAKHQALRLDEIDSGSSPPADHRTGAAHDNDDYLSSPLKPSGHEEDDVMTDMDLEVILATGRDQAQDVAADSALRMQTAPKIEAEIYYFRQQHAASSMDAIKFILGTTVSETSRDAEAKQLAGIREAAHEDITEQTPSRQIHADATVEAETATAKEIFEKVSHDARTINDDVPENHRVEKEAVDGNSIQNATDGPQIEEEQPPPPQGIGELQEASLDLEATGDKVCSDDHISHLSQRLLSPGTLTTGKTIRPDLRQSVVSEGFDMNVHRVVEHEPRAESRSENDEIDMMSASQLSNDLDWHLEREGSICDIPAPTPKRKRATKSVEGTKKKRKVSGLPYSQPLETFIEAPTRQAEEEVLDCIVVDTSERRTQLHSGTAPPTLSTSPGEKSLRKRGKPKRGRALKSAAEASSQEVPDDVSHKSKVEENPEPFFSNPRDLSTSGEAFSNEESDRYETSHVLRTASAEQVSSGNTPEAGPGNQEPELTKRREDTASPGYDHEHGGHEEDVMISLQRVLERLKGAHPGMVDLRAVHDLCFDIRTEAQNAVSRQTVE